MKNPCIQPKLVLYHLLLLMFTLAVCKTTIRSEAATCDSQLGGLIFNRTLSGAICITNDVSFSNIIMTPGTTVSVTTNARVKVLGPIHLLGTSNAPVQISASFENTNGWQGFEFEDTAPGSEFDYVNIEGAKNSAVRLLRSHLLIRNSTFTNNSGPYGGALYVDLQGGYLAVSNSTFSRNRSINDGGAIWASSGTGKVHFVKCKFEDNAANYQYLKRDSQGGAVRNQGNAEFLLCTFQGNQVHALTIFAYDGVRVQGGAIWTAGGDAIISGCTFSNNACQSITDCCTPDTSYAWGGAVFLASGSLVASNSLFVDNWLSALRTHVYKGSAVYVSQGTFTALNSTFTYNKSHAAIHNEAGNVLVRNSIVYFNDYTAQISGSATVAYCDIQGGYPGGVGIINYNPVFDSAYRIVSGSPAIDAGDPAPAYNDVAFPPSLGGVRCDLGFTGGPGASLWLDELYPEPSEIFKIEMGNSILWEHRADTYLECAADPSGPWYTYSGEMFTIGGKRAVLIDPSNEPRRFFRLARAAQ